MNPLALLRMVSPRGWLFIAAVAVLIAFAITVAALVEARGTINTLRDELKACTKTNGQLVAAAKAKAVEEGKAHEQTQADHLAACRDAYRAGAKQLRDDQAVAAGRYLPRSGPGVPAR